MRSSWRTLARRSSTRRPPGHRRAALIAVVTAILSGVGVLGAASSAHADPLYCGPSTYVDQILVQEWGDDQLRIQLTPSNSARFALDSWTATVEEWHAIQGCVAGLYGDRADRIWDQLHCHQDLAAVPGGVGSDGVEWASGPTYDLETWHPTFTENYAEYISTHCGNNLGGEPESGPLGEFHDPSLGQTDLSGAYSSIG